MRIRICWLSLFMYLVGGSMCAATQTSEQTAFDFLATGNSNFAWDLYAALQAQEGNLFFSPYSISTALAMTYAGARGETARQMATVLHFPAKQDQLHPAFAALAKHMQQFEAAGTLQINIANALWVAEKFDLLDPFVKLNKTYYGANLFPVDFAKALEPARQKINAWVAEHTRQKIQELLQKDDIINTTPLVLTNAIYFNAPWAVPFDRKLTSAEPFWITAKQSIETPMMHRHGKFYAVEDQQAGVLILPYSDENVVMGIVLPHEKDGLAAVAAGVNAEQVDDWLRRAEETTLQVALPKLKLSFRLDLKETLSQMGMPAAFANADFTGISKAGLFISKVIHQAEVEVHEQGTEAAAATAVAMGRSMPRQFQVNRPFLFFIMDTSSRSLLFVGRVVDPTKE